MKAKSFRNIATYLKPKRRFPQNFLLPPLYHGGGMTLRVRPRVKFSDLSFHWPKILSGTLRTFLAQEGGVFFFRYQGVDPPVSPKM